MDASNEKPEWFQMTQGDEIPPRAGMRRGVRVLAAVLPLMVLSGALVLAQSQDGPRATASGTLSIASTPAPTTATTPVATTEKTIITSVENTRSSGSVPAIKLPTGGESIDD